MMEVFTLFLFSPYSILNSPSLRTAGVMAECPFWRLCYWNMLAGYWSKALWISINLRLLRTQRQLSKSCSGDSLQETDNSPGEASETVSRSWFTCYLAFWPADRVKYQSTILTFSPSPLTGPWSHPCLSVCARLHFSSFPYIYFFAFSLLDCYVQGRLSLIAPLPIYQCKPWRGARRDAACCTVPLSGLQEDAACIPEPCRSPPSIVKPHRHANLGISVW